MPTCLCGCGEVVTNKWKLGKLLQPLGQELISTGIGFGLERKQKKLQELDDFDYDDHIVSMNESRAVKMREAWATGRHR